MKKLLIPLLLIALHAGFCSQIQIHATFSIDPQTKAYTLSGYEVWTWDGKDQGMVRTPYTIIEAQTKFGTLLNSGAVGTSKTPDIIYLNYEGSTLVKAQAQVTSVSSDKFESKDVAVTAQIASDATSTKIDVEAKEAAVKQAEVNVDQINENP